MPTYEYVCQKCGNGFEAVQSMSDKPLEKCSLIAGRSKKKCGGRVRRQIGAGAGLIFKGSGFYITDYRSEGYKQAAKKDAESAKPATSTDKPTAKAETKADKPATKSVAKK
jgi:putative FmdB family regulatory protein